MSVKNPKAVVFNCHFNGLSIIQELGQNGIECVAMDSVRSIGTFSKFANYIKCPDPAFDETGFVQFLYNYCSEHKVKPVLFPTNDQWAAAVSKNKSIFNEVAYPCVADWEAVNLLIEKKRFYEIGQARKYLTPKTWPLELLEDLNDSCFPICAKPHFRRNSSNGVDKNFFDNMDRLRLTVIDSKHDLYRFIKEESVFLKHLIFQEYIRGLSDRMYTVGLYADQKSKIIGQFTGKRVRGYPADIGDCTVGENHKVPEYVIENTKRIVKDIRFSGIAQFEYMKDLVTNKYILIEINPRSWSWIGITPYCGVSLPMIAYRDLIGLEQQIIMNQQLADGFVRYSFIFQDFRNCLFKYKKSYPQWHMGLIPWLKEYRKANKVIYAEFNTGDLIVACKSLFGFLKSVLISLIKTLKGKKHSVQARY